MSNDVPPARDDEKGHGARAAVPHYMFCQLCKQAEKNGTKDTTPHLCRDSVADAVGLALVAAIREPRRAPFVFLALTDDLCSALSDFLLAQTRPRGRR